MCGICGKLSLRGAERIDPLRIEEMSSAMRHRGPDDRGVYVSRKIGLGHRRLSIIDLHTGAQPLSNEDGTVWAVFNGEIYNYRTLREELIEKGHTFRTQTDTEVIVHLYEEYGEEFVPRLYGMFAIALWDEPRETLLLARDRVGIKPLYYYRTGDGIVFGSEIKALLADPAVPRRVNPAGISLLMSFSYIPGEETLLEGIKKVLPGHYLKIDGSGCVERAYWDLSFAKSREDVPLEEAAQTLDELLRSAVRDHMISDVPVGVLLSGGVDSTALLSYAAEETGQPLGAFTIGFEGEGFADERYYARLAARRFGTRHYDMTITAAEFRAFLPAYVRHMEEPVCEPPAVALYYVSRLAKDHVKVLLSGEGGDEAFAGYPEYRNFLWLEKIKRAAGPLRPLIGRALSLVTGAGPLSRFHRYGRFMALELKDYYYSRTASPLSFMNRYADDVYSPEFFGEFSGSAGREVLAAVRAPLLRAIGTLDLLDAMLYIDTKTWLSDDLLLKADKMTMANSIELRVPFLDHRVLEYAASLPAEFKLNGGTTKYILKRVFEGRVPDEILNRKKTGFPVPYRRWLSGDLQPYVNEVLRSRRARERGYFKRAAVERLLDANRREGSWAKELFLLLVLELWHTLFIDGELSGAPSGDSLAAAL